jgi:hypothetical protein
MTSTTISQQYTKALESMAAMQAKLERLEANEAAARRDSRARADAARQLTTREHLMQRQATARTFQARCDNSLQPWGIRAPAMVAGEPLDDYRRRLLREAQKRLPESDQWRRSRVRDLPDDVLPHAEQQIYDGCRAAALRPDSAAPGEIRRVEERDSNGLVQVKWIGERSFVRDFATPGRRVASFIVNGAHVDASGRALRR